MPRKPPEPSSVRTRRTLRNILRNHGRANLRRLISGLEAGDSGQEIADDIGVTRERVRQWKNALGTEVRFYQPAPEVRELLRE